MCLCDGLWILAAPSMGQYHFSITSSTYAKTRPIFHFPIWMMLFLICMIELSAQRPTNGVASFPGSPRSPLAGRASTNGQTMVTLWYISLRTSCFNFLLFSNLLEWLAMRQLQCSSQELGSIFSYCFCYFTSWVIQYIVARHLLLVHTPPTGINAWVVICRTCPWVVICRPDVRCWDGVTWAWRMSKQCCLGTTCPLL